MKSSIILLFYAINHSPIELDEFHFLSCVIKLFFFKVFVWLLLKKYKTAKDLLLSRRVLWLWTSPISSWILMRPCLRFSWTFWRHIARLLRQFPALMESRSWQFWHTGFYLDLWDLLNKHTFQQQSMNKNSFYSIIF